MLSLFSIDRKKILLFLGTLSIFLIISIFLFPYKIAILYFLEKIGMTAVKVEEKLLGVVLKDLKNNNISVADLSISAGINGLNFSTKGMSGRLDYAGFLVFHFKKVKIGEGVIINDFDGILSGFLKYDLNKDELLSIDLSGDGEKKSLPIGSVKISCKGDRRFSCKLLSQNLSGDLNGVIKNGVLIGEFNGKIFGMDRKAEKVNLSLVGW